MARVRYDEHGFSTMMCRMCSHRTWLCAAVSLDSENSVRATVHVIYVLPIHV